MEQTAEPRCMTWYPADGDGEPLILTSNSEHKFKLFNADTGMCRKTLLAPVFEQPLQQVLVVPANSYDHGDRMLAYVAGDKLGLALLPLDGNPHRYTAMIAHPGPVAQVAVSYDGTRLFTAGGAAGGLNIWTVHSSFLEAAWRLGGEGLAPFVDMLEGGRDGEFYTEMEDYFYFAQLQHQVALSTQNKEYIYI